MLPSPSQPSPLPIPQDTITYKSFSRILLNILTSALGSLYFGFTLSYFSIFPIQQIKTQFSIPLSNETAKGLLNALIPTGALLGAYLSSFLLKNLTRRYLPLNTRTSFLIICAIALLGGILTLISSFQTLLLGRFIEGICVGLYSSICPLFINELVPKELAGRLGTVSQIFIILGILMANVMCLGIDERSYRGARITDGWRWVFGVCIVIVAVQGAVFGLVYRNETPKYLIQVGRYEEAKQLVEELYLPEYADLVYQTLYSQTNLLKTHPSQNDSDSDQQPLLTPKNTRIAILMGFSLSLLQQFSGINVITLYCGDIFTSTLPTHYIKPSRILLPSMKLIGCLSSTYLIKSLGRKTLLQIGTFTVSLILITISICFSLHTSMSHYIITGCLFLYMLTFGLTLGPIVWLMIPEFLDSYWIPYTTMVNWGGSIAMVMGFPVVKRWMGTEVYLFLGMGVWCLGAGVGNWRYLVETKGKSRGEIDREYEEMEVGVGVRVEKGR